jgi:two-component system OmpR family response regulator
VVKTTLARRFLEVFARGEKINLQKMILLVDDDAYFRFAIAAELRAAGYIVQSAEDGDWALRMLEDDDGQGSSFDLIITDLVMPRKNGYMFSTELREIYRDIPILVISGYILEHVEKELRALGRIEFLEKPFEPSEFLSKVEGMISGDAECSPPDH